jgi:RNA polymerase sigma factor (sigma-70 family)
VSSNHKIWEKPVNKKRTQPTQQNGNRGVQADVMMNATDNNVIPIEHAKRKARLEGHTDDELMQLARANVKEAFAELVRRYNRLVRGYCRKWNWERGEDLAQDVFVRLWRARDRYKPRDEFKAYLFMIVVNQCRNDKRSLNRKPPMEPLTPEKKVEAASVDQLEQILEREKLARVHRRIEALSPKLKEAILLRFGSEMSYRQIADITKSNEATVRSRVMLGIQKLKKEL